MGKRQSRPQIVSDELWSLIEPLLPEPPPKQVEGMPQVPDRQALGGILSVLHTDILGVPPARAVLRLGHALLAPPGRLSTS